MVTENKLILRRFFEELFNQGDLTAADEIISVAYRNHNAVPGELPGREGLKQWVAQMRTAVRDLYLTIEDQIAEGDKVVTRWTATGIQQGGFASLPPTGKPMVLTAIQIHLVVDGQIQESWLTWDVVDVTSCAVRS
jgi:steroid delta-isomerase-like uncharacterized protein